jgi:hypothetical protein
MQKFEELARLRQSETEAPLEAMRLEREESSRSASIHTASTCSRDPDLGLTPQLKTNF